MFVYKALQKDVVCALTVQYFIVFIQVGDVVYGRVVLPNKDMEPELSCLEDLNPKQGYALFHNEGYLFHCSLNLARR